MSRPKYHGQFTQELVDYLKRESAQMVDHIVALSRMGVYPEVSDELPPAEIETAPGESITPVPATPPPVLPQTGFVLGKASLAELKGVNDDLQKCVRLALGYYTAIDFRVFDGIRTLTEQAGYVKAGTSKTMKSKHLQGLAVDLVPIIGGVLKWDWVGCYEIAKAMDRAATELGIAHRITWGGAWDKQLDDFGGEAAAYAQAVEDYKRRHPGPDFIDGPHFEILP